MVGIVMVAKLKVVLKILFIMSVIDIQGVTWTMSSKGGPWQWIHEALHSGLHWVGVETVTNPSFRRGICAHLWNCGIWSQCPMNRKEYVRICGIVEYDHNVQWIEMELWNELKCADQWPKHPHAVKIEHQFIGNNYKWIRSPFSKLVETCVSQAHLKKDMQYNCLSILTLFSFPYV